MWHLSLVFPTVIGRQRFLRSDSFITSAEPCRRANPSGSRFLKWLPPSPKILDLPVFLEPQLRATCPGCEEMQSLAGALTLIRERGWQPLAAVCGELHICGRRGHLTFVGGHLPHSSLQQWESTGRRWETKFAERKENWDGSFIRRRNINLPIRSIHCSSNLGPGRYISLTISCNINTAQCGALSRPV